MGKGEGENKREHGSYGKISTAQLSNDFMLSTGALFEFVRLFLTHAVLHHHETTLVSFKAFALEAPRCVDTGAMAAQVRRDAALVNV